MLFLDSSFDAVIKVFAGASPGIPPDAWWIGACVLIVLAFEAGVDAFTKRVPEAPIFIGLIALTAAQGTLMSWEAAAYHLRWAIASGLFIWGVNFAWYKFFGHDALGMGDAKWTMLATAGFGIESVLIAWGVGSVFATIFIGLFRLFKYRIERVTFLPFLFIGLGVGLFRGVFW